MCKKSQGLHGTKNVKKAPKRVSKAKVGNTEVAIIKPKKAKVAPKYTQAELWFFRNEDVLN